MPSIAHNTPRLANAEFWRHFEGDRILATATTFDKVEGAMGLFADLDLGSGTRRSSSPCHGNTSR
jgi:5-enolpyruvylshikimate-3-phosphate synthase